MSQAKSERVIVKSRAGSVFTDNARERDGSLEAEPGHNDQGAGEPHEPREHLHGGVHRERHVQPPPPPPKV